MKLYVGQAGFQGSLQRYAQRLGMVELVAQPDRLPRLAKVQQWARSVPEGFVFSLVAPAEVASLRGGPSADKALQYGHKVCAALGASWWVLRTPPDVTPSATNRERLRVVVQRLRESGCRIAWEPAGVWEPAAVRGLAAELRVTPVADLSRYESANAFLDDTRLVYTRLRALGSAARIGAAAAERLAERLRDAEVAYVIVEGGGAGRVAQVLYEELGDSRSSSKEAQ